MAGVTGQLETGTNIDGGTDGTAIGNVADALKVTTVSSPLDGTKQTFSASMSFIVSALATDIFTLTGSATKTVKVRELYLAMSAASGVVAAINILKRSTANSAGTSTSPLVVPFDSTNAAGTAVARAYTINPTIGTLVGSLATKQIYVSGGGPGYTEFFYEYNVEVGQPWTLRGTSEVIAINFGAVTFSGNTVRVTVVWTEE